MYETKIILGTIFFSFVLMIVMYHISTKTKFNSELDRFTNKIPVITGLFVALGVYLTYSVLHLTVQQMGETSTLQIIDRGWVLPNKLLYDMHGSCPNLIDSFYYQWQIKKMGITQYNKKDDDWAAANYVSLLIFQSWEDFFTTSNLDSTADTTWIANFMQFTKSPILKNIWSVQKANYNIQTQNFGDLLFEYSSKYRPNNAKELTDLAKMITNSSEYKKLFNKEK